LIVWGDVILHLSRTFSDLLGWHSLLDYKRLKVYAEGMFSVGGIEDIWGFVDGTFRAFCKPSASDEAQRAAYSGHKKLHGQNWQAIVTPDGLIVLLVGPFFGPANNWTMWRLSGCKEEIQLVMEGHKMLWVYGDPAYRLSYGVMAPYGAAQGRRFLSSRQQAFNRSLSTVCIAVENAFSMVQRLWTYTAFGKSLSAGKQLIGAIFAVAVLLTNCHFCLRGNQISEQFGVSPPSVENYLL
jgi:hypothetical protein